MELSFDDERALLQAKRTELMAGVAVIDAALAALGTTTIPNNGDRRGPEGVTAGRRPMSAKARKAASARMKAYWAAKRKGVRR